MAQDSSTVLRENLLQLMAARGDTQATVAGRGGISQRSVGYLVNYGLTHRTAPTLRTVDGVAKAFGLQSWLLFVPGLTTELLTSDVLQKLVGNFSAANPYGRETIYRIAETEARYGAEAPAAGRKKAS